MDQDVALDLARQFRERIHYNGNVQEFDNVIIDLIKTVESQCAQVVEQTPTQLFIVSTPANILGLIASAIRGEV